MLATAGLITPATHNRGAISNQASMTEWAALDWGLHLHIDATLHPLSLLGNLCHLAGLDSLQAEGKQSYEARVLCDRVLCVVLLQVLEEADCRQLGMGLFLGVAQGSDEPLRFIHLTYTPEGPITQKASYNSTAQHSVVLRRSNPHLPDSLQPCKHHGLSRSTCTSHACAPQCVTAHLLQWPLVLRVCIPWQHVMGCLVLGCRVQVLG